MVESLAGFDFRSMITLEHVDDSANAALSLVDEVIHFETNLLEKNIQLQPDTPSFDHNQFFLVHPSSSGTDPKELTNDALRIIQATLHLKQKYHTHYHILVQFFTLVIFAQHVSYLKIHCSRDIRGQN